MLSWQFRNNECKHRILSTPLLWLTSSREDCNGTESPLAGGMLSVLEQHFHAICQRPETPSAQPLQLSRPTYSNEVHPFTCLLRFAETPCLLLTFFYGKCPSVAPDRSLYVGTGWYVVQVS